MDYRKQAQSYMAVSVETASPGKLVLMLYDGALRFLAQAKLAFEMEDELERIREVNNALIRTQNILNELQGALDMNVEGEFAQTMYRLYDYMIRELHRANVEKTSEPLEVVETMLRQIRDAWEEMLRKESETAQPLTSVSQSA